MNYYSRGFSAIDKSILSLCSAGCTLLLTTPSIARAQVVPDNTLGNESSVVNSAEEIIEGGATRGINLFHSFSEFGIPENNAIYFANPDGINNIIGRVTGNNASQIFGTLGVSGEANLFLINPNGILFGADASLDLRGAFIASSASSVIFAEGQQFSAIDPESPPLLVVNMPIGLGFTDPPQSIVSEAELIAEPGQTLALIGGDITLENGELNAESGTIELGSVAEGSISINATDSGFEFGYQEVNAFLDINLFNGAFIDTSGEGAGNISIRARNFIASDDAGIVATTFGAEDGGTISINTSDALELSGFAGLFSATEGAGKASDIKIDAQRFVLSEEAIIESSVICLESNSCTAGNGGDLQIFASESVDLNRMGLNVNDVVGVLTTTEASGNAGDITVETQKLTVRNGASISSFSAMESDGQAGNITINASESVDLIGVAEDGLSPSGISSQAQTGRGGNITIKTTKLIARDGAIASASTFGTGDAGNLSVIASDSIELIGTAGQANFLSGLAAQVAIFAPDDAGNAGNLTIETGKLIVRDGAQILNTGRFGGNGGTLKINASEFILLQGTAPDADLVIGSSGIFASAELVENEFGDLILPTGNAGELDIVTSQLTVENGAKISVDNFGSGQGGNATFNVDNLIIKDGGAIRAGSFGGGIGGTLTVNATEAVEIIGTGSIGNNSVKSTLFTQTEGAGNAGNLTIDTTNLTVRDGGEVTASTLNAGNAGNIVLEISDEVTLIGDNSGLFASTGENATGEGENIITRNQTPTRVTLQDNATIAVNSEGSAEGGNINLTAQELTLDNGSITAETTSDRGGNISLTIDNILQFTNRGEITASAGTAQAEGDGGNVNINADFILAFATDNQFEITANAFQGNGGNIQLTTNSFFGSEFVNLSASSEQGIDGNVFIEVSEFDPARGLTKLPANVVDASQQISQACSPKDGETSSFVVTGRGGIPLSSGESLRGSAVVTNWVDEPTATTRKLTKNLTIPANSKIVEAQRWIINDRGNLELVAESPTMPIDISCN